MIAPTTMTFFSRFENDILSGKKTITIRDKKESTCSGATLSIA